MCNTFKEVVARDLLFQETYMRIALQIAGLSYCNKRKVGALIVKGRNIVAYGFNGSISGMPNICEDKEGKTLPHIIHAEVNALLKAGVEANGADMYVTCYPCVECAKMMAQAGIHRVFYVTDHKNDGRVNMYGMHAIHLFENENND